MDDGILRPHRLVARGMLEPIERAANAITLKDYGAAYEPEHAAPPRAQVALGV